MTHSLKERELYISSNNMDSSWTWVRKVPTSIQYEEEKDRRTDQWVFDYCYSKIYVNKPILIIAVGNLNIYEYALTKYGYKFAEYLKWWIIGWMKYKSNDEIENIFLFSVIGDENLYISNSEFLKLKKIS